MDLVDEAIANGVQFDWIGGDGLYGHSYELGKGLDERGQFFVLDAHKDELGYLQKPGKEEGLPVHCNQMLPKSA